MYIPEFILLAIVIILIICWCRNTEKLKDDFNKQKEYIKNQHKEEK